ncbi:MAG: TetR-like C-terminal domain-containing protein, partial [Acidimicrobiia bacterium]
DGSPVPGYQAPVTTIAPATRVALVLTHLLVDAGAAGVLTEAPIARVPTGALALDLDRLTDVFTGVPESIIVRALTVWASLYGTVSFELFGQFNNVIAASSQYFDAAMTELGIFVGLPSE